MVKKMNWFEKSELDLKKKTNLFDKINWFEKI